MTSFPTLRTQTEVLDARLMKGIWASTQLHVVGVICLLFLLWGAPVPSWNEVAYVTAAYRPAHPEFLAHDWTFAGSWPDREVTHRLLRPLAEILSLNAFGWVGRLLGWLFGSLALFRLGNAFRLPPWATSVAVALWLCSGQALFAGEWAVGGFESKTYAYAVVFLAIAGLLERRPVWVAFLLGVALSLHFGVGFWAASILGGTVLLALRPDFRTLTRAMAMFVAGALPGAIPMALHIGSGSARMPGDFEFMAYVRNPHHMDPFMFETTAVVLTLAMLTFNLWFAKQRLDEHEYRVSLCLQMLGALALVIGFFARAFDWVAILILTPFRLPPLLILLLFCFHVGMAVSGRARLRWEEPLAWFALALLVCLEDPLDTLRYQARNNLRVGLEEPDEMAHAFSWIARNLPEDAVVIAPPWRDDSFLGMRRAQVGSWKVPRPDALAEWRRRMTDIGGPFPDPSAKTQARQREVVLEGLRNAYEALPSERMVELGFRYGAGWAVTTSSYELPIAFEAGIVHVYRLRD